MYFLTQKINSMATHDTIPSKDGEFDTFQGNLVATVTANKVAWAIPDPAIAELGTPQAAWAAQNKKNVTTSQRTAKNEARTAYEKVLRPFIQKWIYINSNMTAADIELCGLKPHDKHHGNIPAPTTVPLIDVTLAKGNVLEIIFRQGLDEEGSSRRGKPKGVSGCRLYFNIGSEPKTPSDCPRMGDSTRSPIKVPMPSGIGGQTVWFYACWVNARGDQGPFTKLDSFVMPY
jgi:hypothetical protein